MIDRIVHHADVLTLKGASYRLRGRGIESLGITSHRVLSAGSSFAEDRFTGAVNNASTREVWNKGGLYVSVSRTVEGAFGSTAAT